VPRGDGVSSGDEVELVAFDVGEGAPPGRALGDVVEFGGAQGEQPGGFGVIDAPSTGARHAMSVGPVAHPRARDHAGDDQRRIGRKDGSECHRDRGQRAEVRRERGDRLLAWAGVLPSRAASS
jgi:hypothetical protein